MIENVATVAYIAASGLFILSLGGLSSPKTAKSGNLFGMIGMTIALIATLLISDFSSVGILLSMMIPGAIVGAILAARVAMTSMPELVAAFHSLVGLAAVFVAAGALYAPEAFGIGTPGLVVMALMRGVRLFGRRRVQA